MTPSQALAYVRKHGVVLESARGPVVSLAQAAAVAEIAGSWWGHPKGREIFALTRAIRDSTEVCVCRAVAGKITYVHRRLWPALVRVAPRLPRRHLAMLREVHRQDGRHEIEELAFPKWVPADVRRAAARLTAAEAMATLGRWTAWPDRDSA